MRKIYEERWFVRHPNSTAAKDEAVGFIEVFEDGGRFTVNGSSPVGTLSPTGGIQWRANDRAQPLTTADEAFRFAVNARPQSREAMVEAFARHGFSLSAEVAAPPRPVTEADASAALRACLEDEERWRRENPFSR